MPETGEHSPLKVAKGIETFLESRQVTLQFLKAAFGKENVEGMTRGITHLVGLDTPVTEPFLSKAGQLVEKYSS